MSSDDESVPVPRRTGRRSDSSRPVRIDSFHYHANDLSELRKLTEVDPELARQVVRDRREAQRSEDRSFRLGLVAASVIAVVILGGAAYIVANVGLLATFLFVMGMLGVSHLLRVVLTGQWSDTSWFGKTFGSKPPPEA